MAPIFSSQYEINESTGDDVNSCDTAAISYSALSSNVMPFQYMDNLKTESMIPIIRSMSSSTYQEDLSAILVREINAMQKRIPVIMLCQKSLMILNWIQKQSGQF